ncbi:hypothetical protein C5B42_01765 [Candidatus Cerribacteria bacterium 'Amazon FNV 2010 28 9']|uniref:Uncharacterized protein n=1 Tax=Candidatus Cerribacteria bacterium 'Amazon FNV 2010 28 9' TaxID=2081795 RepID=A0A317JUF7_9BACT|nr:MAG: hypothetical protein C5B42_01765 [Candidatus Cerribacteria bacterium 'Amazon FNV 2010 28 9']
MVTQSNAIQSTTQKYLEISDITNDLILLQDGSCSLVLNTSAINFDLFSEEEQDATIYAYAALLNSLSFPIEIVIRSQQKDVSGYLELLKNQEVHAYNPLQKKQIRDYRMFIEQLVQERNVLEKKFYIIITASPIELGVPGSASVVPGLPKTTKTVPVFDKYAVLEKAATILGPRRDHLIHQCARIGLYAQQLKTQELIQLFYTIYNPESAKGLKVSDSSAYTTPLVQANLRVSEDQAQLPQHPDEQAQPSTQPAAPQIPVAANPVASSPAQAAPVTSSQPSQSVNPATLPSQQTVEQPKPIIQSPMVSETPTLHMTPSALQSTPLDLKPPTPPSVEISSINIQESTAQNMQPQTVFVQPVTPPLQPSIAPNVSLKEEPVFNSDLKPPTPPVSSL